VTGASACPGGADAGASGASGDSFTGGGSAPGAGGGGGGGYVGGGQGGGRAADACGNAAGSGGGGGGSSFAASGLSAQFTGGIRRGDGQVSIAYANPIGAAAHSYTTQPDRALVVPAGAGVLSGASAPSGIPLSASVVSPPGHGSLTLNANGSFTYAPAAGYFGGDSFNYRVADAAGDYATATVALTVAKPPSASISAPADGALYALGQAVGASFVCAEAPGGPGIASCTGTVGNAEPIDTSTVGSHRFTVTATSSDGLDSQKTVTYTVAAPPPAPPSPLPLPLPPSPAPPPLAVKIDTGHARLVDRTVKVGLSCHGGSAGSRCGGVISLVSRVQRSGKRVPPRRNRATKAIVLAREPYTVPSGQMQMVALPLTLAGARLLNQVQRRRLRATATATGAGGAEREIVLELASQPKP
jgi:hypothetical protein